MKEIRTDVLVVGGGGGAIRAAIEADREGAAVLIVTKGRLGKSGATAYQVSEMAGFNVPDGIKDKRDTPEHYYEDMMTASQGMADPELVQVVAEGALDAHKQLKDWGVPFKQENGQDYAFLSCFSSCARTHVIPGHGEPILKALLAHCTTRIQRMENSMILQLLIHEGQCVGAYGLCEGEEVLIYAKAVILGTGGAGQLFEKNMNPKDVTGDGYALGYLAGAELINMEFMQVGIGISSPRTALLNAYVWGGYPRIEDVNGNSIFHSLNVDQKQVMDAHQTHFPFSSSDESKFFEIGIQKAIREGRGTRNHGVRCDMTMMREDYVRSCTNQFGLHEMWPEVVSFLASREISILDGPVEIACFAHAVNGGIRIDRNGRSSIPGLYALGETAGGPHGADRLGGNMMVTCQVFGKAAGKAAAAEAKKKSDWDRNQTEWKAEIGGIRKILYSHAPVPEMKCQLQEWNQKYLLILRNENGLEELERRIQDLETQFMEAPAGGVRRTENVELYHMIITSKLMAEAARNRKESRGSHYREDFPEKKNAFEEPYRIRQKQPKRQG